MSEKPPTYSDTGSKTAHQPNLKRFEDFKDWRGKWCRMTAVGRNLVKDWVSNDLQFDPTEKLPGNYIEVWEAKIKLQETIKEIRSIQKQRVKLQQELDKLNDTYRCKNLSFNTQIAKVDKLSDPGKIWSPYDKCNFLIITDYYPLDSRYYQKSSWPKINRQGHSYIYRTSTGILITFDNSDIDHKIVIESQETSCVRVTLPEGMVFKLTKSNFIECPVYVVDNDEEDFTIEHPTDAEYKTLGLSPTGKTLYRTFRLNGITVTEARSEQYIANLQKEKKLMALERQKRREQEQADIQKRREEDERRRENGEEVDGDMPNVIFYYDAFVKSHNRLPDGRRTWVFYTDRELKNHFYTALGDMTYKGACHNAKLSLRVKIRKGVVKKNEITELFLAP